MMKEKQAVKASEATVFPMTMVQKQVRIHNDIDIVESFT